MEEEHNTQPKASGEILKILELFSGSRSLGNIADELGHCVFSVDWENYKNTDLVIDIEYLKTDLIPFIPDIIWASPDCTTYSIAAISSHRDGVTPTSEYAKKCDRTNESVIRLINSYLINNDVLFYIENPVGMMRKMKFMKNIPRTTVWYCRYGDFRAKPTDIWSNNIYSLFNQDGWIPRDICRNGNIHCSHEKAPRGSKTGTQGLDSPYIRSVVPRELLVDILISSQKKIDKNKIIKS